MAAAGTISGFKGAIALSDLDGQAIEFNAKSWSIDWTGDVHDTTDFTTVGPKTFIGGLTSWTGSFECFIDKTTALLSGGLGTCPTDGDAKFYISDSSDYFSGDIIITGLGLSTSVDGLPMVSASFQGTGVLAQTSA